MRRKVLITGLGVVSPIGTNVQELVGSLSTTRSGISSCQTSPLTRSFPAGVVPVSFESRFAKTEVPYLDRCPQMAIVAAEQAIADAGLRTFGDYRQRAGIYCGNVRGGSSTLFAWNEQMLVNGKQSARPFAIMASMQNAMAAQLSIRYQVFGPVITHGTACTSSGTAIGDAMRAIRDGYLDVAIVGGAEAPLSATEFGLMDGTRALANVDPSDVSRSCKPFSRDRRGLVLGEGAAFLILESDRHALLRGAACYGELSGFGIASDGFHIGKPHVDGQVAAIRAALADGGLQPDDIDYFNAHGTATRDGDEVEARSIRTVFGDSGCSTLVSSTKSVHGHLLGAASALELVITVLAMSQSIVPATAHLEEIDPLCALNHQANSARLDQPVDNAMSFSCGFGGTNVALAVSKVSDMTPRRLQ